MDPERPITLFDLNSMRTPPAWCTYAWRVRLVLNYKRLHYQTQWVAYSDIADIVSRFGPRANSEHPLYTLPVIRSESRLEVIMGSSEIIQYLENEYDWLRRVIPKGPSDAQVVLVNAIDINVTDKMMRMVVPTAARMMQEGKDRDSFIKYKERELGLKIADMFPPDKRDGLWKALKAGLDHISDAIDGIQRRDGENWPFGLGRPTWADFVLCSTFIWFEVAGPEGGWEMIKTWNGRKWERLYESCRPYMSLK